jgi:signal peptidase I
MNRWAVLAVTLLGIVLTVGAIAPGLAPVVVTSPTSASMTPTAPPHSLVIVTDAEPTVGDIALFETPSRTDAVLHRIVDTAGDSETFVTQGDANQLTDQEAGDPPIPKSDVYGTVPTIAGHPLVVPYAGIVLTNPVVGFGIWALLGASLLYTTTGGRRVRETVAGAPVRLHVVAIAVAVLVLLPVVSLGTAATVHTEILTTTTAPEETPYLVQPGEAGERTIRVSSPVGWGIETTTQVDGDLRIDSIEQSPETGSQLVTVVNDPRSTPGVQSGSVTVYSYPAVLPQSVLSDLASVHPLLAGFVSAVPIAGGMILLAFAAFDPKLPLRASRNAIQRRRRTETRQHVD